MSSFPRFVALPYSPWSLKAKWALDHQHIRYRYVNYLPMLGEPILRAATGRWRGTISVPWLFTEDESIDGSFAIARWADAHGTGQTLFPAGRDADIARWEERSEAMLSAARPLVGERMLR